MCVQVNTASSEEEEESRAGSEEQHADTSSCQVSEAASTLRRRACCNAERPSPAGIIVTAGGAALGGGTALPARGAAAGRTSASGFLRKPQHLARRAQPAAAGRLRWVRDPARGLYGAAGCTTTALTQSPTRRVAYVAILKPLPRHISAPDVAASMHTALGLWPSAVLRPMRHDGACMPRMRRGAAALRRFHEERERERECVACASGSMNFAYVRCEGTTAVRAVPPAITSPPCMSPCCERRAAAQVLAMGARMFVRVVESSPTGRASCAHNKKRQDTQPRLPQKQSIQVPPTKIRSRPGSCPRRPHGSNCPTEPPPARLASPSDRPELSGFASKTQSTHLGLACRQPAPRLLTGRKGKAASGTAA